MFRRLFHWQFRSLTYRMVAACMMVALLIYGISFVQMRQILHQAIGGWVGQIAQARAEAAAAALRQRLDAVLARAAQAGVPGDPSLDLPAGTLAVWQTESGQRQGWQRLGNGAGSNATVSTLDAARQASLEAGCAGAPRSTGWQLRSSAAASTTAAGARPMLLWCGAAQAPGLRALQIDPGWLTTEAQGLLKLQDEVSGQVLGSPFVHAPALSQWLLPPPDDAPRLSQMRDTAQQELGALGLIRQPDTGMVARASLLPGQLEIGLVMGATTLAQVYQRYVLMMLASMLKDMLLILATVAIVSRGVTRGLRSLMAQTELIAAGQLDRPLPRIPGQDEVGRLARAFAHMQAALREQLERLRQSTAAQQKLESELAIARQIQQSMLPPLAGGRLAGRCPVAAVLQPAREVGGDFYDCFSLGRGRVCLVVGDVAGKGIPAALLMARTIALIRGLGPQHVSPAAILSAANRELCVNNDECMFVTLYCAVLDLETGQCCHASAGHEAPSLRRGGAVEILRLDTGAAAGLDPEASYPEQAWKLGAGDVLLLYSDGITEALGARGEWFGLDRLRQALAASPCAQPGWVVRSVQQALAEFVADAGQSDDITLFALQYAAAAASATAPELPMLTLNGLPTPHEALRPCLRELLSAGGGLAGLIDDAELVAEEWITNARSYGGGPDRPHGPRISMQVEVDAAGITLGFEDDGRPFDPLSEIAPAGLGASDEQREAGGFGFHLVRALSHSLHYEHRGGRNCLQVRLQPSIPMNPEDSP